MSKREVEEKKINIYDFKNKEIDLPWPHKNFHYNSWDNREPSAQDKEPKQTSQVWRVETENRETTKEQFHSKCCYTNYNNRTPSPFQKTITTLH